jgi:transcriptional regulator with XRE-family HTH domain
LIKNVASGLIARNEKPFAGAPMAARLTSKQLRERSYARRTSGGDSKKPKKDRATQSKGADTYVTGSNAPSSDLNLEVSIGRRVRMLRQRLQLTATDLATQAGLSPGMLSKIENGGTSPSLSTLRSLSEALNVPMTSFFADFEERRDCSYVHAGQGVLIERRGTKAGHRYELLGHSLSGDIVVEPYLISLSEGATPYTQFQHDGMEFIYMLSGKVVYRHADKLYPMAPGDALFFDAGALHGPEELVRTPMTYLSIIIYPRP